MGKNLRQQRRGKGSPKYRSPSHRYLGKVKYEPLSDEKKEGIVVDIIDAPGRTTPLAIVKFGDKKELMIPAEGLKVGDRVGYNVGNDIGSILPLGEIPEGTKIYNIEISPGDGGKLCRSSGTFATVMAKTKDKVSVLLPTKVLKTLSAKCRATIGIVAGFGRKERPLLKAGKKYHIMHALGKVYPRTSGVAMNPVDHPFGGSTKPGKHKTVSRHMPPGKKVGSISARRTGKKKGRKRQVKE